MQFIMNQHQIKDKSLTVGTVKKKKKTGTVRTQNFIDFIATFVSSIKTLRRRFNKINSS